MSKSTASSLVADIDEKRSSKDAPKCYVCGEPATCVGAYEGGPQQFGCDIHCGHGCEDGHCDRLGAVRWKYECSLDRLVAETDGAFDIDLDRGNDDHPLDCINAQFEVPRGRGREIVERFYAWLSEQR